MNNSRIVDNRILHFTNKTIRLPTIFVDVNPKQMIYAAGDGLGGFDKEEKNINNKKTNIEIFTQLGFNIFVCAAYEKTNIQYIRDNHELNIVLCIITGDNTIDYPILNTLFFNMIDIINTDDTRIYPSCKTAFNMLKHGGVCENVQKKLIDNCWKLNFDEEKINEKSNISSFTKRDQIFMNATATANTNTNENATYNKNIKQRKNSWKIWHNKHPYTGGKRTKTFKNKRKTNKRQKYC